MISGCTKIGEKNSFFTNDTSMTCLKEHSVSTFLGKSTIETQWALNSGVLINYTPDGGGLIWYEKYPKRESQWIFLTNTLSPNGLNIEIDLNCFISNY